MTCVCVVGRGKEEEEEGRETMALLKALFTDVNADLVQAMLD